MRKFVSALAALTLFLPPNEALARNIVLSNDDGLTSNVVALYRALKEQGHDVIVSVPCGNQSGMGAAIWFARPLAPLASDCKNGAAKAGGPSAAQMTGEGLDQGDFHYVDGTPVMAMLYGIDVVAARRWGAEPDLVLSGPNEGQNVGAIILSSGTVSNAQIAAVRGLPAIALSAGSNTSDDGQLANPNSAAVARLSAELVDTLDARSGGGPLLPAGIALNVNFPDELDGAEWRISRIGSYNAYKLRFVEDMAASASPMVLAIARARGTELPQLPGVSLDMNDAAPEPDQQNDESIVYRQDIAVSPMQAGYEYYPAASGWLSRELHMLLEGSGN